MIRVVAGVIHYKDTLLLARRGPGQKLSGYWEFPGGKMERDESPEIALAREIDEEFSLAITVDRVLLRYGYSYDFGDLELIAVEAFAQTDSLILHVHDFARWLPLLRLPEFELAPADLPLASYLLSRV